MVAHLVGAGRPGVRGAGEMTGSTAKSALVLGGLREAAPDTLRYRIWHIPARLAHHARQRILKISPDWPWKEAFLTCWQRLCALPAPA